MTRLNFRDKMTRGESAGVGGGGGEWFGSETFCFHSAIYVTSNITKTFYLLKNDTIVFQMAI